MRTWRWYTRLIMKHGPAAIFIVLVIIFAFFPFYWMIITSFKPPSEIFRDPPTFIPQNLYLGGYRKLLVDPAFVGYMKNSTIVAGGTALIATFVASFAAYSFSKFRFPGNRVMSFSLFLTQLFPQSVILVPLFIVFQHYRLYDTYAALILSNLAFSVPVSIWLMIGFFEAIPQELGDAALIDGCSRLGVLFRIILPIARTGVVATAMYIFISAWSELLFALTFTTSKTIRTLPVALSMFIGQYTADWSGLLAAATLTCLPVAIIFLVLQRYFIEGMTSGAMKE
ncbi:MAG: carbohydrate ABC transporter permease [Firmicutes bacterium]|nr:carbohydrate ABC transporter permease [Bacillota bacterium]